MSSVVYRLVMYHLAVKARLTHYLLKWMSVRWEDEKKKSVNQTLLSYSQF